MDKEEITLNLLNELPPFKGKAETVVRIAELILEAKEQKGEYGKYIVFEINESDCLEQHSIKLDTIEQAIEFAKTIKTNTPYIFREVLPTPPNTKECEG